MRMNTAFRLALLSIVCSPAFHGMAAANDYFTIRVVDSQTGRGVPLVETEDHQSHPALHRQQMASSPSTSQA